MRFHPQSTIVGLILITHLVVPPGAFGEGSAKQTDTAACDVSRARAVAAQVQRYYDAVTDLSADFEQITESVVLSTGDPSAAGSAMISRGRVIFSKPGRMRWSYEHPQKSFVISDGSVVWIYEVGAPQATRIPGAEDYLAGAALQFLIGEGDLVATFDVAPGSCQAGRMGLELIPKEPTSFERLGLVADPETGRILETSIVDLFGNRTRIRFAGVVVGVEPPAGSFEFQPPRGVEVIGLDAEG